MALLNNYCEQVRVASLKGKIYKNDLVWPKSIETRNVRKYGDFFYTPSHRLTVFKCSSPFSKVY